VRRAVFALVVVLAGIPAETVSAHRAETGTGCNVDYKGLKTLSDPQRELVNLNPKSTTVTAINALAQSQRTPTTRSTPFSRRVWQVGAQLVEFKLEGDSDIQLILFDNGADLIAEMPAAQCLPRATRDRKAIVAARQKFEASCGKPEKRWKPLGAVAVFSGVGFFDKPHTQKPHAQNFAELHPVPGFKLASGHC
jgi:hypothetical protein